MPKKDDSYTIADTTPPGGSGRPFIWAILAVVLIAVGGIVYFMNRKPETTAVTTPVGAQQGTPASSAQASTGGGSVASPESSSPKDGSGTASTAVSAPAKAVVAAPVKEVVHFGFNEVAVMASDSGRLKGFCSQVASSLGKIDVAGHADAVGSDESNQAISVRRAQSVASMLKNCGLGEKQTIEVQGLGKSKPTADNATESGRAANRRVEFVFNASR